MLTGSERAVGTVAAFGLFGAGYAYATAGWRGLIAMTVLGAVAIAIMGGASVAAAGDDDPDRDM